MTRKSSCGDRRPKGLVESEYGSDLDKIVLSDEEIHDRNADWICVFQNHRALPLRSMILGPPASPCRCALDVIVSFTMPVDIVSMHNLFLQDVVNGMAYVHVMCVIHT